MKKVFHKILAGMMSVAILASLTACGGKSISPSSSTAASSGTASSKAEAKVPEGNVEIRFSWWGGDSRHEATLAAIDAFMVKYPNITVKAEYGAWDGWAEKCATQLSGGTAPDLMQVNWNWLYQFSSDGSRFADLNDYSNLISLQNYPQDILEQGVVADKLQGLPLGITGKVFYWNKSTFDKAGIPVPSSFEEIIAAGSIFKEKLGDDYYPLGMYEYERLILMMYYLQSKYGKEWAVDNQLNYSVEEIKEGFDWLNKLQEEHVLPAISKIRGDGANVLEKNPNWANGKYAGFYEWDSAQKKLQEALEPGQEFVLGQFPTDLGSDNAALTKVNMCYAITESSKNKEAAALLMEFLTSDPEGISIIGTERGMLANTVAREILEGEGKLSGLTYEGNLLVMEHAGFSLDPNFENSALKDTTGIYYEVIEQLSSGGDSAQLAQYFVDEVNAVYAKNPF